MIIPNVLAELRAERGAKWVTAKGTGAVVAISTVVDLGQGWGQRGKATIGTVRGSHTESPNKELWVEAEGKVGEMV